MADPGGYDPTLREKLLGGLQWSITAGYAFLIGFLAVVWYLYANRTLVSLDASRAFPVVLVAAFVAGYLWVALPSRSASAAARAHARRVEVTVVLLVLGFAFPFGASVLRERLGPATTPLPLFEFGVAYALALALSYGLVYGLGVRPVLGRRERPDRGE
ncbi:hypothetical protein NGM10_08250 [Halorussus salilacus]|uniref:hypothetical protein n=1 Tax=Halorussus salilacus TaxID=2953750 RepID=UPI00209D064B|nr:hypothetical protein [Halorussus salilacus]USZ66732.1 hypothetical protein NGM10_08250 [Halorussus salilacus]